MKPTQSTSTSQQYPEAKLWSSSDVARFLGCSERQVFNLRHKGIPTIKLGGLVRFEPARVRQWVVEVSESGNTDPRARQLADIAASGDEDAAECAVADRFREFPDIKG
jgi:hypothetical protein